MDTLKSYRLATGTTPGELEDQVEELMEDGYEPFGSLQLNTSIHGTTTFYQPMLLGDCDF